MTGEKRLDVVCEEYKSLLAMKDSSILWGSGKG